MPYAVKELELPHLLSLFVGAFIALVHGGNIIGKVLPDGTVVDTAGNVIGKADLPGKKVRFARDKNGKVIGLLDENGNVVDFDGKVIGKMQPDGSIVDAAGNVIGQADAADAARSRSAFVAAKQGPNRRPKDSILQKKRSGAIWSDKSQVFFKIF